MFMKKKNIYVWLVSGNQAHTDLYLKNILIDNN